MLKKNKKIIITGIIFLLIILFIGTYHALNGNTSNISTNILGNDSSNDVSLKKEYINGDNYKQYKTVNDTFLLGKKWFLYNIKDDGSFVYLKSLKKGESSKNNIIRQLLAFRVVANLCQQGDEKFCLIHRSNLDFIFKNGLYKTEIKDGQKIGYILYDSKAKLGSSALLLRLLISSPYSNEYSQQLQELVAGIKFLQNSDGSFKSPFFVVSPSFEYNEERKLNFYSGEAILALMEYYRKTNDQQILDMAKKSEDYYLIKYVDNMQKNYYPAYVPWHTMALSKLWYATNDSKYIEAIFKLNDELLKIQDRGSYPGRFYSSRHPEYGKPHSASDAIYAESLVTAYKIALEQKDEKRQKNYILAIKLSLNNIAGLQFCNELNDNYSNIPKKNCGSLLIRKGSNLTRVDSLAHAMDFVSALKKLLGIK